jgi:glycerophosphoryl diester phosphodiesterase
VSKQINIQGHRGARGLYPENTLRGFIEAVKLGVNAIELDVVISADKKVVVSHEAWMNEDFCSLPDGTPVEKGTGKDYNLYKMRYTEIKKFDCGKMANAEFPMQMAMPSYKPLLDEVITYVELYTKENNLSPVSYNIELKTEPEDELFSPPPGMFVDLVHDELSKHQLDDRIQIQSFDVRLLRELKKKDASIRIGLLVENDESLETNMERLGFIPATYSPEFFLVTSTLVSEVHRQDMKIIPWTVNEQEDMLRLLSLGVDGIITDYPNRLIELTKRNTIN